MRAWIWSKSRHEEGYSVLSRSKIQVSISTNGRPRMEFIRYRLAGPDQCSCAFGEQLEQNRVPHPSVDDDRRLYPAVNRVETGFDFGDHAAIDDAFGDELPRPRGGGCGGDRSGHGVGIDVVGLALRADADRRDDRDDVGLLEGVEHSGGDPLRLAAKTEGDFGPAAGLGPGPHQLPRLDQPAILPGKADRTAALGVDCRDEL